MASLRPFIPLGIPQNATKLMGMPKNFKLSKHAQILASNLAKNEVVVSPGRNNQLSVISYHEVKSENSWVLKDDILLAKNGDSAAIHAPGGVFRVDIGYQSHFICEPNQLVGAIGNIKTDSVYSESRLDVIRTLFKRYFKTIGSSLYTVYAAVHPVFSRIPIPRKLIGDVKSKLKLLQLPTPATELLHKVNVSIRHAIRRVKARMFYLTHPRKLKIEGPCSILIKTS